MKTLSIWLFCGVILSCVASLVLVDQASARTNYEKAFRKKYIGEEKSKEEKSLAEETKRVGKCFVCHDPRKDDDGKASKKNRNPYGQELAKLLTKDDQKDEDKILKMIEKVENLKAKDAKKTFGEIIKAGKMPFEYPEEKKEDK